MNTIQSQMKAVFEEFLVQDAKFDGGNASAGTRARAAMMELTKLIKARRTEITEVKHQRTADKAA